MIKNIMKGFVCLLPWKLKRIVLIKFWNYEIAPSAHIGLSWVFPKKLKMDDFSKIGHFNVVIHLDEVLLGRYVSIARNNWVTGFPSNTNSLHFQHQKDRRSVLKIGDHSAITKSHHIDCTNLIQIGKFVTIAGYHSQFLTHSIDIYNNQQDSHSIIIGDYCFLGTGVIILGGSVIPSYCVLGAGTVLNKKFNTEYKLLAGVPCQEAKSLDKAKVKYFQREKGYVI